MQKALDNSHVLMGHEHSLPRRLQAGPGWAIRTFLEMNTIDMFQVETGQVQTQSHSDAYLL
jgi:hypothetical protein